MKKLGRFDAVAKYYDRLAVFFYGTAIRKAQTYYLKYIPDNAHVLVLGGGTGWWLERLLQKNSTCMIWYVEASAEMIRCAKKNSSNTSRIKFIHGTHENIPNHVKFDVVITFFFLDLFDDTSLPSLIDQIKQVTRRRSIWLVSDFVNEKKWHSILLFWMYFFFRLVDALDARVLPDWEHAIKNEHINLFFSTSFFGKFIRSNMYGV